MNQQIKTQRYSSLDVLKFFAAFGVVCIHYAPEWLNPIVRCSVPFFFLVTGFYYSTMVESGKFWHQIKKLFIMLVCSSLLYALWHLQVEFRHHTLQKWLHTTFSQEHIENLVFYGEDLFSSHLWYFYSIIYTMLVLYIADKFKFAKLLRMALPLLLLIFYIGNYIDCSHFVFRNFLFMGIPCVLIGCSIRENRVSLFAKLSNHKYVWLIMLLFLAMTIAEMFVIKSLHYDKQVDMYIFTLALVVTIFYFAINHPNFGHDSILSTIGRKYTAYIYIFHIIAENIFGHFVNRTTILGAIIYPFAVFILTLLISYCYVKTKSIFKEFCFLHAKQ